MATRRVTWLNAQHFPRPLATNENENRAKRIPLLFSIRMLFYFYSGREVPPRVAASSCLPPTTTLQCGRVHYSIDLSSLSITSLCYERVLTVPQPPSDSLILYIQFFFVVCLIFCVYLIKKTIQPWIKFLSMTYFLVGSRLDTQKKRSDVFFYFVSKIALSTKSKSVNFLNVPYRYDRRRDGNLEARALVCSLAEFLQPSIVIALLRRTASTPSHQRRRVCVAWHDRVFLSAWFTRYILFPLKWFKVALVFNAFWHIG